VNQVDLGGSGGHFGNDGACICIVLSNLNFIFCLTHISDLGEGSLTEQHHGRLGYATSTCARGG
jgi:hypothetical protein